ncbi:MAG TPA: hypothetical protein VIC56_01505 [Gemmatimonadota bacterium]|jgi:hypothetical protein
MATFESLRAAVRAHDLGDTLRRAEFQAILEALTAEEEVRALAPAELRGLRGFLVGTTRRVFFAHAGVAGRAVSPVAPAGQTPRSVGEAGGAVTLVFRGADGREVEVGSVPPRLARGFTAPAAAPRGNGPTPGG